MKRFRSLIALALSLALILLSPGSSAYHAAAQTMGASVNGSAVIGVTGVAGANLGRTAGVNAIPSLAPSSLNLSPLLSAPSIAPAALPTASALAATEPLGAGAALPLAVGKGPQKAIAPGAAKTAALATLKANLPAPSAESKSVEMQAAVARLQFDGAAAKKDSGSGMPDRDLDENGNPSKDGGIDESGNPRRSGGEGGPDDRSDPDQSDRGGSGGGLFGVFGLGGAPAIGDRAGFSLRAAKKDSGKGMPDQSTDENGNPSKDGGIDEIGSPRRTGGESGPDDRSDPDQSDRGGSEMFGIGLLDGAMRAAGAHLAGAFLPVVAALGLEVGQVGAGPSAPSNGGAASNGPVDLIVMFGEKKTTLHDAHISNVDVNLPSGVEQYTRLQQAMLAQLETAGLDEAVLEPYKGTPLATYARINAATIRVAGGSVAEFTKEMAARGFTVYPNAERKIIRPVPVTPEDMDPAARNAVTMDENLKIVKADTVQSIAEKRWGKPEMGFWSGLWAKVFKTEPAQPKFGVIDSGADLSHPLLKRVKEVKNMTSGENVDDIGHGSWVTSTVLHMAPWSRNTTHYKTFLNGGATLDDILKALTQAGNDGNLVISNSWGDDQGDPQGPDAQLVKKLAQEGHIMVFAAGNAGSGKNTIGAPAIVTYKDAATGAIRVVSVAAAGRDKKVAYFSSRGPGSPVTAKDPGYKDHRPDLTAVGYNIEGAWPAALNDADRVDGEKGPVKAISGTSMSTPGVAGALMLLAMMFGVTEMGAKLDAIVNAVMSTLEKTGKNTVDEEGEGFMNVDAAYHKLLETLGATSSREVGFHAATWSREIVTARDLNPSIEMRAATPDIAYQAAGPIKRFLMRIFGAAPKI